jgi:hypothetical protein
MAVTFDKQVRFQTYSNIVIDDIRLQISTLKTIYQNSEQNFEEGITQLMAIISNNIDWDNISEDEDVEILQHLQGADTFSQIAKDTLSQYFIVAVYSLYEKGLKKIFSSTGKFTTDKIESCYKKKNLENLLSNIFSIDYSDLSDSTLIEELRCLNNDIKHNGKVGKELTQTNNKWIENQLIENIYDDFNRIKEAPINFLNDLVSKITPQI